MSKLYVVEFALARDEKFRPWVDYPSGQVKCYMTRKEADHARKMMIHNSPYLRYTRISRVQTKEGKD